MDLSALLQTLITGASQGAQTLANLDIPIPDAALLFAFGLLVYAVWANGRTGSSRLREEVESLYQGELLAANRRAQQARGDLNRANLMLERERQKRRRETNRAVKRPTHAKSSVVEMAKPAVKHA